MKFDIDIYLPFVDGDDEQYISQMQERAELESNHKHTVSGLQRVNDFGQYRFALRSIFYCVPWVRYIHLVFHNERQIPDWLDKNHPKLKIHLHREYFDPEITLPTFSSFVIDTQIDRVPGLAEHFIYVEDDHFFCSSVSPSDFFSADGKPKLDYIERKYGMKKWNARSAFDDSPRTVFPNIWKFSNWIWRTELKIENNIEVRFFDDHRPMPFVKSVISKTNEMVPEVYQASIKESFRRGNVLAMNVYLLGMCYQGIAIRSRFWKFWFADLPCEMPRIIRQKPMIDLSISGIKNPSCLMCFFFAIKYLSKRLFFWPVPRLNLAHHLTGNINDRTHFTGKGEDWILKSKIRNDIDNLMLNIFPEKSKFELKD